MRLEDIIEVVNVKLKLLSQNMNTLEVKYIYLVDHFDEMSVKVINKYFQGDRKQKILAAGGIN
jgi:hypothetical protein